MESCLGDIMNTHDFVNSDRTTKCREKMNELFQLEDGLTDWQIGFLDNVVDWEGCFTVRQAERIEKIHEELIG